MNKIFDHDEFFEFYKEEELGFKILNDFESHFDIGVQKLFKGIMDQNWRTVQQECKLLKGIIGIVFMKKQQPAIYELLSILYQHSTVIRNNEQNYFEFLESFNDEVKLQAMDFLIPIFEELRILKLDVSKCTKSGVSNDIYLKEMEQIKELHENMKKEYQKKQSESQTSNSVITKLDKPENVSCTEKCIIF